MSKEKKKLGFSAHIITVLFVAVGAVCGAIMAQRVFLTDLSGADGLFRLAMLFICFYIAFYAQVIIHEGGHLIFGLISGYRFSSFRIGSLMLIKGTDSRLSIKKFKLAGTGGQCLMSPPELKDGLIPYRLYNLGGSILNLVSAAIFLGLSLLFPEVSLIGTAFLLFAVLGLAFALINGVPLHTPMIDNDGYNAISLGKDPAALYAFYLQLKVNEMQTHNIRLKDMPEEWFELPQKEKLNNPIIAACAVNTASCLIDKGELIEALGLIDSLLSSKTAIVGIHRAMLKNDLIYLKLVLGYDTESIETLLDEQQKKFMCSMKSFPAIIRTGYAVALLYKNDIIAAQKAYDQFSRVSKTYPYKGDLEGERELLQKASEKL